VSALVFLFFVPFQILKWMTQHGRGINLLRLLASVAKCYTKSLGYA